MQVNKVILMVLKQQISLVKCSIRKLHQDLHLQITEQFFFKGNQRTEPKNKKTLEGLFSTAALSNSPVLYLSVHFKNLKGSSYSTSLSSLYWGITLRERKQHKASLKICSSVCVCVCVRAPSICVIVSCCSVALLFLTQTADGQRAPRSFSAPHT